MESVQIRISNELHTPSESKDFEGEINLDDFTISGATFKPCSQCTWSVNISNTGSGVLFISGKASCDLGSTCALCLEDTTLNINGTIEGYCKLKDSAKLPDDIGEDECVVLEEDGTIDLFDLIKSAITLEIPLQVVCSENCEGLTQYCDHFEREALNTPFSILKNYDFSEN